MKNCNKVKHTCGIKTYSICTAWEGDVNSQSELLDEDCLDQEVVDQDQYNQLEKIWEDTDLTLLGNNCLEYTDKKAKTVILELESQICDLKERVTELENRQLCDIPISACGIDLNCLSIPCEQEILTMADLFNAIILRLCD